MDLSASLRYARIVTKLWGWEAVLENNEKYCVKILWLKRGVQSSLHFHSYKDETFVVLSGTVGLEIASPVGFGGSLPFAYRRMTPGDKHRLFPNTPHRFRAVTEEATILEVSTTHDDTDVTRIEESRTIPPAQGDSGPPNAP